MNKGESSSFAAAHAHASAPPPYNPFTDPTQSSGSLGLPAYEGENTGYRADSKSIYSDDSGDEGSIHMPEAPGRTIYNVDFQKGTWHMDYLIKDADNKPLYYVDNKYLTAPLRGGDADVVIYKGGDKNGEVVFCSRSNVFWGTKHQITYGHPDAASSTHAELVLQNPISLTTSWTPPGSEKRYKWQRIHGKEAKELAGKKGSLLNLKLTDLETGELMAVYINNGMKNWRKAGVYQISPNPEVGPEWDNYVLWTGCVLTEKERRARRWAYSTGAY